MGITDRQAIEELTSRERTWVRFYKLALKRLIRAQPEGDPAQLTQRAEQLASESIKILDKKVASYEAEVARITNEAAETLKRGGLL